MGRATLRTSCLVVLSLALPCLSVAAQAASGDAQATGFEALHETWLADSELQLERPVEAPEPEIPRRSIGFFAWLARVLGALGPVFQVIFYAGLAAIVLAILYFIITQATDFRLDRLGKRKKPEEDDVLQPAAPDAAMARSLLEQADALAREGRYSEAVHLLLFRSINDIQARRSQRLSTALTAREIGALGNLPAAPREALRPIIGLVERSHFGGRPLGPADWSTARTSYEQFAFGEAWA